MNMVLEQEVFTYYKEGVLTWIWLQDVEQHETQNPFRRWQEEYSEQQYESWAVGVSVQGRTSIAEKANWFAAVAEKSYEQAGIEYWDTG
jgi:hypothetical protein